MKTSRSPVTNGTKRLLLAQVSVVSPVRNLERSLKRQSWCHVYLQFNTSGANPNFMWVIWECNWSECKEIQKLCLFFCPTAHFHLSAVGFLLFLMPWSDLVVFVGRRADQVAMWQRETPWQVEHCSPVSKKTHKAVFTAGRSSRPMVLIVLLNVWRKPEHRHWVFRFHFNIVTIKRTRALMPNRLTSLFY